MTAVLSSEVFAGLVAGAAGHSAQARFDSLPAGVQGPPGYAQFLAHITARAVNGARTWNGQALVGKYTVTPNTTSQGNLVGTSYLDAFRPGVGSSVSRAVQHGFPGSAEFSAYVAAQKAAYIEVVAVSDRAVPALDRNGYLSAADAVVGASAQLVELIYWDGDSARIMNPLAGTGPSLYTF